MRPVYDELLDLYKENKQNGGTQKGLPGESGRNSEGIYVPAFYDVAYKEDGTIASFTPNNAACHSDHSASRWLWT